MTSAKLASSRWPRRGTGHSSSQLVRWSLGITSELILKEKEFVREGHSDKKSTGKDRKCKRSHVCSHHSPPGLLLLSICALLTSGHSYELSVKCHFLCEAFSDGSGRHSAPPTPRHHHPQARHGIRDWIFRYTHSFTELPHTTS